MHTKDEAGSLAKNVNLALFPKVFFFGPLVILVRGGVSGWAPDPITLMPVSAKMKFPITERKGSSARRA